MPHTIPSASTASCDYNFSLLVLSTFYKTELSYNDTYSLEVTCLARHFYMNILALEKSHMHENPTPEKFSGNPRKGKIKNVE